MESERLRPAPLCDNGETSSHNSTEPHGDSKSAQQTAHLTMIADSLPHSEWTYS